MNLSILTIIVIILDFKMVRGLKKVFPRFSSRHWRGIKLAFIIQASLSVAILLFAIFFNRKISDYRFFTWYFYMFGAVCTVYVPKAYIAFFLLVDRFVKLSKNSQHVVAKCGYWTSLFVAFLFVWGIVFGRYNFTVEQVEIPLANLPQSFDGYRIVHLSDIHTGSFVGSVHRFQEVTDLINEQMPDLIVMTGDVVNNFADEILPFIPIFSQMKARDGKFAVLGNHDYGGYHDWSNLADSVANFKAIKNNIEQMGFTVLENQSITIERGDSCRIALVGVENWGIFERFPKRADLEKALETVRDVPFRILLTHDPAFWTKFVEGKADIALTLAGHTHGMQLGLKIGNKRYNPLFKMRFGFLAGLYQTGEQYIYINRGLGVGLFPGRIGMPPEITVITLRKEK